MNTPDSTCYSMVDLNKTVGHMGSVQRTTTFIAQYVLLRKLNVCGNVSMYTLRFIAYLKRLHVNITSVNVVNNTCNTNCIFRNVSPNIILIINNNC